MSNQDNFHVATATARMLVSRNMQRVYMFWVKREQYFIHCVEQWTPEYQHAFRQVMRIQNMYDSLECGKITNLWHWHQLALAEFRRENPDWNR